MFMLRVFVKLLLKCREMSKYCTVVSTRIETSFLFQVTPAYPQ